MYQKEIAALGGTDGEEWHTRLSLIDKLQNIVILARGENICFMNAIGLGRLGYSEITPLLGYPVTGLFHHDYEQMSSLGLSTLAEESMIPLKILRRNGETIEVELSPEDIAKREQKRQNQIEALRADYAADRITTFTELVHSDLFADMLEAANYLLGETYKDPAAVMAGGEFRCGRLVQRADLAGPSHPTAQSGSHSAQKPR